MGNSKLHPITMIVRSIHYSDRLHSIPPLVVSCYNICIFFYHKPLIKDLGNIRSVLLLIQGITDE